MLIDRSAFKAAAKEIRWENGKKYDQRWWGTVPDDMTEGERIMAMDLDLFHVHCTSTACIAGLGALIGGYSLLAYEGEQNIEDVLLPDSPFVIDEDGYLSAECETVAVSEAGRMVFFPELTEYSVGETNDGGDWFSVAGSMFDSDWATYTLREEGKEGIAKILDAIGRTRSDAKAFQMIEDHQAYREYELFFGQRENSYA